MSAVATRRYRHQLHNALNQAKLHYDGRRLQVPARLQKEEMHTAPRGVQMCEYFAKWKLAKAS